MPCDYGGQVTKKIIKKKNKIKTFSREADLNHRPKDICCTSTVLRSTS